MALLGYARVSTDQQSLDLQIKRLLEAGVREDRIFSDKRSGKNDDRKGLTALKMRAEREDEVLVTKLDRLGRNTLDMIQIVQEWTATGVTVKFLDEGLSNDGPMGEMVITILSAIAQAERGRILERTNEGRKAAMDKGIQFGRKQKQISRDAIDMIKAGASAKDVVAATGIGRASYYRLKKEIAA